MIDLKQYAPDRRKKKKKKRSQNQELRESLEAAREALHAQIRESDDAQALARRALRKIAAARSKVEAL